MIIVSSGTGDVDDLTGTKSVRQPTPAFPFNCVEIVEFALEGQLLLRLSLERGPRFDRCRCGGLRSKNIARYERHELVRQ